MQHYFVSRINDKFVLNDEQTHQIKVVMRNRIGDELVFINEGYFYHVKISSLNPIEVEVISFEKADTELNVDITLLYCLAKKDKIDFAIQKATELGAKRVILVNSSRSILKIHKDEVEKKLLRYNKIAQEAAEQCRRGYALKVENVIDFKDIKNYLSDLNLIAYENERSLTLNKEMLKDKKSISILIGCEGGFSFDEVQYANEISFQSLCLGKRILRSETAVVYALSLLSHYVENILC